MIDEYDLGDLAQGGPTAQPGSELVPHLEFTAGGRLSVDSAASAAVNALQRGIVAEKVMSPSKSLPKVAVSRFGQEEREARRDLGESP